MSDTQRIDPNVYATAKLANPARTALTVVGVLLIAAGILVISVASGNISHEQNVAGFVTALGGDAGPTPALTAGYVWLWVGVAACVFGVILICARIIISAARR